MMLPGTSTNFSRAADSSCHGVFIFIGNKHPNAAVIRNDRMPLLSFSLP